MELEDLKKDLTSKITTAWCLELRARGPLNEAQMLMVEKFAMVVVDALHNAWLAGARYVAGEALEVLIQDIQNKDEGFDSLFKFFKI